MKQKHKSKYFFTVLAVILSLTFSLAGCSIPNGPDKHTDGDVPHTSEQTSKSSETENPQPELDTPDIKPGEDLSKDTANLDAVVMQLLEGGVKVRPTITTDVSGGQVAEQRLGEDDGTDITVKFTSDTVFQIEEIDRSTYSSNYIDADKNDVKIDSSIYVWGTYSGTELLAERVVVLRFI